MVGAPCRKCHACLTPRQETTDEETVVTMTMMRAPAFRRFGFIRKVGEKRTRSGEARRLTLILFSLIRLLCLGFRMSLLDHESHCSFLTIFTALRTSIGNATGMG